MRMTTRFLIVSCLLVPVGAKAADASDPPPMNCNSAVPPKVDFKTFVDTCRAQAAAQRAKSGMSAEMAAAVASAYDSRTTVAGLNFSAAPTWSDADIMTQFASIRDKRYMTTPNDPNPPAGFQRRISWLYPNDGCFSRAEEFDKQASVAGKTRPYKLFVFGNPSDLRVYTDNDPNGVVYWWYHVVAAVKNSAGELIVFDPAISPCRPLPWKEWLLTMQSDLSFYDNLAAGHGVARWDAMPAWCWARRRPGAAIAASR